MQILVMGGTRFVGKPLVARLMAQGHTLSLFTRGKNPVPARLDPLTDKVLIAAPLLWFAASGILPLWAIWILLARELLISGWRAGASDGAPASWGGKAKTILQFLSLLLLLWPPGWVGQSTLVVCGWWLFWPSWALALTSALDYLKPQSGWRRS